MLDKLPPGLSDSLAPLWVFFLSSLGAVVGFLEDFKPEDAWQVKVLKAVTRASSSALAAVLTYHLLLAMDIPQSWHVILVGIAGHMGVECLKALGDLWKSKLVSK